MILFDLEESGTLSKSRQIVRKIREMIEQGVLDPGERIPSTRKMAEMLQVHRSTVSSAYQDLWSLGFLDLRQGAVPVIRRRVPLTSDKDRISGSAVDWSSFSSPATESLWEDYSSREKPSPRHPGQPGEMVSFVPFRMDERLFLIRSFRACLGRAFREEGPSLLSYGDVSGYGPLREIIANRMSTHGMSVSSEEILVTNGAQHGLDLVLRMMAAPGRTVAMEVPGYSQIIPLLRHHGLEIAEIPMRENGMDLDVLEELCRRDPPQLVYTMPNFQNPTGITTDQPHRERLLSLCSVYGIPILEDGFEEEMKYTGKVVLPIKSMDSENRVIYCGTFSKVLFPGLRIGWIGAHRDCVMRLTALRRSGELSPPSLLQASLARFFTGGHYERHLASMHRVYRRRMQSALDALDRHVSSSWARWTRPGGGYLIWMEMAPPPVDVDWTGVLGSEGVMAALGDQFFPSCPESTFFRLSISCLDEEEIEEGFRRLGNAFKKVYRV